MLAAPGWAGALERAARARTTVIVGGIDSGKSTLAAFLADGLAGRGARVLVLDADLGQSAIGPPAALGLGRAASPVRCLAEIPAAALWFVGATSPVGRLDEVAAGVARLAARAEPGDRLIVDTCGLVAAPQGVALKRRKLGVLEPDLVIALERAGECDAVLADCPGEILRLPVSPGARARSAGERARFRAEAFRAYFEGAACLDVPLRDEGAASTFASTDPVDGHVLVGIEDAAGDTLGLGAVAGVGADGRSLSVITPVPALRIARLRSSVGSVPLATLHEVRP